MSSHRQLSSYERHALTAYREGMDGIGSDKINTFLRTNNILDSGEELLTFPTHQRVIQKICTLIKGIDTKLVPAEKKRKVYRGIPGSLYDAIKYQGIMVNKGYTSSTTDINTAIAFSQGNERGVVLIFSIPPHMKIHEYGGHEKEILIERNTQFTHFIEKKQEGNILFVEAVITKYVFPSPKDLQLQDSKIAEKSRANSIKQLQSILDEMDAMDKDLEWLHQ